MERIAVISDVHANILGLDAVLKDAENQGADNLVFLGDLVMAGPRPGEVLVRGTPGGTGLPGYAFPSNCSD